MAAPAAPRLLRLVVAAFPSRRLAGATALGLTAAVLGVAVGHLTAPFKSAPLAVQAAYLTQNSSGSSANRVYVPALGTRGSQGDCSSTLSVTNLGPAATKAILVLWDELDAGAAACEAPAAVLCSGLLRPGSAWDFGPDWPADVSSGIVFSVTAQRLSEIGVFVGNDAMVADYVCDQIRADVIGDCAAYAAFCGGIRGRRQSLRAAP